MKIMLITRDGGFVRDGDIPPYQPPPEVITWGTRVFVRAIMPTPSSDAPVTYVEGLMYSLEVADSYTGRE